MVLLTDAQRNMNTEKAYGEMQLAIHGDALNILVLLEVNAVATLADGVDYIQKGQEKMLGSDISVSHFYIVIWKGMFIKIYDRL